MRTTLWERMHSWTYKHPWAITSFLVGVGVGVLLCLPLLPFTLPDSAAQLIGSFLGAAIAVTGAIWVTTIKDRQFRNELRLAAIVIYEPFVQSLNQRMEVVLPLDGQTVPLSPDASESLAHGRNLAKVTRSSFDDLRPAFLSNPNDIIVHRHLLGAMDRFISFFDSEFVRDNSRSQRQQEERQRAFNQPDVPMTDPLPVDLTALRRAVENLEAVMETVGR